jgi:acetate kinase
MKILVSNIGSTSFKYRLFQMDGAAQRELASGGADRIGDAGGVLKFRGISGQVHETRRDFANHGEAIRHVLDGLVADGALKSQRDLDAVAFKAVMAGDVEPVVLVDHELLERMEYFVPVAPAHNPPYIAAMRLFAEALGDTPLVAAFEPGFHRTNPPRRRYYAVPWEWAQKYGVKRYGFHGASHAYIAWRTAELMGQRAGRIISCHLGGSSSICAIRDGASVAVSMGLSPQSGLPQSNRAGDFDPFALPLLQESAGLDAAKVLATLGSRSGLAALSGTSGDMRDICDAADAGSERAALTKDLFVTAVRDYVGSYLLELGGADAIVFTGGIGQNNAWLREAICRDMDFAGIRIDSARNAAARGEARVEADGSKAAIWVMPTNEELIVARQAAELLGRTSPAERRAHKAAPSDRGRTDLPGI